MSLTTHLQRLTREGVFTCCWCGGEFARDVWAYWDEDLAISSRCSGFVCRDCWSDAREFTAADQVRP